MAQYTYITLNDGTKWRIKGNVQPQVGSGPYRAVTVEDTAKTSAPGASKGGSSSAQAVSAADMAAAKAAAEAAAKEKARKEKIKAVNSSREKELKYLGNSYEAQKTAARLASEDNMRQLYIAYMQGLRGIPQQSALWGAGGEIESLKNRSRLNYEDNRAKESRNYEGTLGELQQKYNDDLRELEERYLQKLLNI